MSAATTLVPPGASPARRAVTVTEVEVVVEHDGAAPLADTLAALDLGPFRPVELSELEAGVSRVRFEPVRAGLALGDRNVIDLQLRLSRVVTVAQCTSIRAAALA